MILLDTNILLRYAKKSDPGYPVVDAAITTLFTAGEILCVVPQTIYEFWASSIRPLTANGLAYSITETQDQVARIKRLFRFLNDRPALFTEWETLVVAYQCHGRISFDSRLVAAMKTHNITNILTFNGGDFARYPGITVLDPNTIAASSIPPSP